MKSSFDQIIERLKAYKKKYYQNLLLKGIILSSALLLSIFLVFNSIEYTLRLASPFRAGLLLVFGLVLLIIVWHWIIRPIVQLLSIRKQLSHEEAARQIGAYFPNINDKLLNTIQLQETNTSESALIQASIAQRSKELNLFTFTEAVSFKENQQYLKYLIPPVLICIVLLLFIPQLLTEGTERIINFNKEYVPEAPFEFELLNEELKAFKNEDFSLKLNFKGKYRPQDAYIIVGGRRIKMQKQEEAFMHTFNNIQHETSFHFEAAGFNSSTYDITVLSRPNLKGFNINLLYPEYLQKEKERMENAGNLLIPEGTIVQWQFGSLNADSLSIYFEKENKRYIAEEVGRQLFSFKKKALESDVYEVKLQNQDSKNREEIKYSIEVIKDKYPEVSLETFQDTTLYNFLVLGGNIADDYGLTQLKVFYQVEEQNQASPSSKFKSFLLPIRPGQIQQSYYFPWHLDSLNLAMGSQINFYLQVWDNDGVNGHKATKTRVYHFKVPSETEVQEKLAEGRNQTRDKIATSREKAESIKESLEELENSLKGKKRLDWQDKKKIEEIIAKKEALNEALETLKEQNKLNNERQERFGEQNKQLREKAGQLQELMNELLDEETKSLYEELKKLLEEQRNANTIQEQLSKINNKESNLEKELERTLELFKRMQFDQKLENVIENVDELAKKQEKLSKATEEANKEDTEQLGKDQQELNEAFENTEKQRKELQELNQELKNPHPLQNTEKEEQEIAEEQQKSQEALDKNKRNKAAKHQQKAAEGMKDLAKKLSKMQSSMEMGMMQENLDHLRDIVDNLVKLSFDQEDLMDQFKAVNQSDPRFVKLSQDQLKLKDDAKIIEDSLLSLANRVFQIKSFVTREVESMNEYMTGSIEALRERNKAKAISEQQFSMTSMNNLALLLDDVLRQMQQQMSDAMGMPQKGKGNQPSMSMSELQQQLNKQISELKRSGKSGRALSEELARLAAQQEQIRRALQSQMQEAGEKAGKGKGGSGKQIIEKMKETEADLVNKELSEKTIKRQQDILTRLLESEDALREREKDDEREAEQPKGYEQIVPKAFEDYIKAKQKEIELLKTVPPRLNPYYLQEVNEYFNRLKNTTI